MYKIIGADQKTYGPVSADTIREWIAARRANAGTQVQAEGSADWKPLSEFPEFKDALAAEPPPAPRAPLPVAPAPPPKTSGMAIASLVCGLLGCFVVPAIVGLILGIASLIKINRSQGTLDGKGVAIAGLCVSGLMLLMLIPMQAALLLPALAKAKGRAQTINCVSNLKQLALAARMYANDSGDKFPYATNWCDALLAYQVPQKVYRCPASPGTLSGYGYNAALSGRSEAEVNPSTVMFFEIDGGWNASGGPADMVQPSRHGRVINIAFADGSVRQVHTYELQGLRWKP